MLTRNPFLVVVLMLCGSLAATAEEAYFAGVLGGVSTLSADGRSVITGDSIATSLYKPENGPAVLGIFGRHLGDYLSIQGTYGWNRNAITLTSSQTAGASPVFYEQHRRATQHTAIGEVMVYFRKRKSRVRPYLSAGAGAVRLRSSDSTIKQTTGVSELAPGGFASTEPAIRVAVGIDLFIKGGWAFRFTFSETIRKNPISGQLSPPGERNLANFQNFFGFLKQF